MDLVTIARIVRARGNKGEVAAVPLSATPERATRVFVNGAEYGVEKAWRHGDHVVFKLAGVDSISSAEPLAGAEICIPREERASLPAGEYYQSDLIGCTVVTRKGETIGIVEGWHEFGGPPLLEVNANGREILIPFAKSICIDINVAQRRIVVDLPEGLTDL